MGGYNLVQASHEGAGREGGNGQEGPTDRREGVDGCTVAGSDAKTSSLHSSTGVGQSCIEAHGQVRVIYIFPSLVC